MLTCQLCYFPPPAEVLGQFLTVPPGLQLPVLKASLHDPSRLLLQGALKWGGQGEEGASAMTRAC